MLVFVYTFLLTVCSCYIWKKSHCQWLWCMHSTSEIISMQIFLLYRLLTVNVYKLVIVKCMWSVSYYEIITHLFTKVYKYSITQFLPPRFIKNKYKLTKIIQKSFCFVVENWFFRKFKENGKVTARWQFQAIRLCRKTCQWHDGNHSQKRLWC